MSRVKGKSSNVQPTNAKQRLREQNRLSAQRSREHLKETLSRLRDRIPKDLLHTGSDWKSRIVLSALDYIELLEHQLMKKTVMENQNFFLTQDCWNPLK